MMGLLRSLLRPFLSKITAQEVHRITVPPIRESEEIGLAIDPRAIERRDRGWVYTCTRLNARGVASTPLKLFVKQAANGRARVSPRLITRDFPTRPVDKDAQNELCSRSSLRAILKDAHGMEEVTEHPLLDLMERINPIENAFSFFEALSVSLDLTGATFVIKVRSKAGNIAELIAVPTHLVRIVPSSTTLISHYLYRADSSVEELIVPLEDMLHFREANVLRPFLGQPPLAAALAPADLHREALIYEQALLRNNAVPDTLITVEGTPDTAAEDRFTARWQKHKGAKNAGRVGILGNVKDVHRLGMSGRDMSFKDGHQTWKDEVCGVFGVPLAFVSRDTNLANIQGSLTLHARNTIKPRLLKIEQLLNQSLVPDFGDDTLFLAFDDPVPEDRAAKRADMIARRDHGISTPNEERARTGDPAFDEPEADMAHIANNLRPISEERRQETQDRQDQAAQQNAQQANASNAPETPQGRGRRQTASVSGLATKVIVPGKHASQILRLVIIRTLEDMEMDAKTAIEGLSITKADKADEDDRQLTRLIKGVTAALRPWKSSLAKRVIEPLKSLVEIGGAHAMVEMAVGGTFNVETHAVTAAIKQFAEGFASRVIDVGGELLSEQLRKGIVAGEPINVLSHRVAKAFQVIKDSRVERIVRTETQRALNIGSINGWQQSGVVEAKEWLASSDACPYCMEAEKRFNVKAGGAAIPLGTPFFMKGDTLEADFPVDQEIGSPLEESDRTEKRTLKLDYSDTPGPPLHPHCRCTVIPVVKEFGT